MMITHRVPSTPDPASLFAGHRRLRAKYAEQMAQLSDHRRNSEQHETTLIHHAVEAEAQLAACTVAKNAHLEALRVAQLVKQLK